MTTIQPESEKLRKAVRWIVEARTDEADKSIDKLIEAACLRFNLSPLEEEFLRRQLKKTE